MTGTRALLRLAARDARRDRGRSLLVVALVALPVAGLVAAGTLTDSGTATAAEDAERVLGRADVLLQPVADVLDGPVDDEALRAALPDTLDGTEIEIVRRVPATVSVAGVTRRLALEDTRLRPDALAAGRLELTAGSAPATGDEITLSPAVADDIEADIGDRIHLEPLGEVAVVGIARDPEQLSRLFATTMPGTLDEQEAARAEVLVDFPDDRAVDLGPTVAVDGAEATRRVRFTGVTRDGLLSQRFSAAERALFLLVGGLAAVEVALVAGAAFAISVRRRQRELGLLATAGASQRHVRRSVLLTGLTVGTAGAVLGVAVGLVASRAALPFLEGAFDRAITDFRVSLPWVLISAALGLLAALAGAWWPARTVARLPVLVALSGRRPTPSTSRASLLKGLLLIAVGTGACIFAAGRLGQAALPVFLIGCIAVVLGAGLISPWLLEQLGRTARLLPVGARMAVRDAARFRTRNGPVVTAAMAGLAASVTVTTILASLEAADQADYQPQLPNHVGLASGSAGAAHAIGSAIGAETLPVLELQADVLAAGTRSSLAAALDRDHRLAQALAGPQAVADLEAGRAVALDADVPGTVDVQAADAGNAPAGKLVTSLDVVHHRIDNDDGADSYRALPQVLLPDTEKLVALARPATEDTQHLLVLDRSADNEVIEVAEGAADDLGEPITVTVERGFESRYTILARVATVGGGLAGLLIAGVAIALAAAESRPDLRTLAAVGASRRTRRSLAAARGLLLAGLGAILAVPAGLVPAAAMLATIPSQPPLVLPWGTLLVVAVLVPALACAGSVVLGARDPATMARAA